MQLRRNLIYSTFALILSLAPGCIGAKQVEQLDSRRTDPTAHSSAAESGDLVADTNLDLNVHRSGVLVMAHGGGADWNRAIESVVAPLRKAYPIEIAFGMAKTSSIRDAVQRLEQQGVNQIAVVRMFISGESFRHETEHILGLRSDLHGENKYDATTKPQTTPSFHPTTSASSHASGVHMMEPPKPIDSNAVFYLSERGVAESPLIEDILIDRVRSLSVNPSRESVLFLAHGPADDVENERWLAQMRHRTERLRTLGPFVDIRCETLREDWPARRAASQDRIRQYICAHSVNGQRVIVVPFRVAGFGPYAKVLLDINYVADERGFCPHPTMTHWIDQTARRRLPSLPKALFDAGGS